jgi:hypothetical protein
MEVEPGMYRQQGSVRVTSFIELIGIRQQLFQSQLQYVPKITARKKCWNDAAIAKLGCMREGWCNYDCLAGINRVYLWAQWCCQRILA